MTTKQKELGQYFTTDLVVEFMCSLAKSNISSILEPSAGEGVFLKHLSKIYDKNIIDAYEIDPTLKNESDIKINYEDFLTANINKKYDLIIGNPPYVRWKNIPKELKDTLKNDKKWKKFVNGLSDLLYPFIYRCVELLNENGELIFITPSFWLQTKHAQKLREHLINHGNLELLINFNEAKIFPNVSSNIIIFKFTKNAKNIKVINLKTRKQITQETLDNISDLIPKINDEFYLNDETFEVFSYPTFNNSNPWKSIPPKIEKILQKIEKTCEINSPKVLIENKKYDLASLLTKDDLNQFNLNEKDFKKVKYLDNTYFVKGNQEQMTLFSNYTNITRYVRLEDIVDIGNGMVSGLDSAFKIKDGVELENKQIMVAKAADLTQYFNKSITNYIFVNDIEDLDTLKNEYSKIYNHLKEFESKLDERFSYNKDIPWWHWVFLRNKELMECSQEKIFVPCKERVDKRGYIRFAYVQGDIYGTQDVTVLVKKQDIKEDFKYILALLNSNLLFKWINYKGLKRGGVLEFSEKPLSKIPIRMINWENKKEVDLYTKIVNCAEKMINEQKENNKLKIQIEKYIEELYLQ